MSAICRLLAVGRAAAYRSERPRPRRYQRHDDPVVYAQLRAVLRERGSYGYRRATVLVNRDYGRGYNRKRIQRLMQKMGIEAIYPKPRLSDPAPEHRIYPYRLRGWRSQGRIRSGVGSTGYMGSTCLPID